MQATAIKALETKYFFILFLLYCGLFLSEIFFSFLSTIFSDVG